MSDSTKGRNNDLLKFKAEILEAGIESCLPCNLSHTWLQELSRQADLMLNEDDDPDGSDCAEIAGVVIRILFYQSEQGTDLLSLSADVLLKHVQSYATELAFEEIYRKTDIKYEAATVETILKRERILHWKQ